ncbi:MAG: GntR family transcriptional regulator [Roseovarius sp.]
MNKTSTLSAAPGGSETANSDQIYNKIFDAIVDHNLAPGTHLKEDELCDIFGIGRTRMRAVLSRLAADHVVNLVANRGAFVAKPSVEEAREVFRARRVIECHLAQRAAENASDSIREAMHVHLQHENHARAAGDLVQVIKRCGKYHQVLADQADSPIMAHFVRELIARSSLIIAVYETKNPDEAELEEHTRLTELILDGKGDDAARLMDSHLRGIEGRLDFSSKEEAKLDLRSSLLSP